MKTNLTNLLIDNLSDEINGEKENSIEDERNEKGN